MLTVNGKNYQSPNWSTPYNQGGAVIDSYKIDVIDMRVGNPKDGFIYTGPINLEFSVQEMKRDDTDTKEGNKVFKGSVKGMATGENWIKFDQDFIPLEELVD